MQVMQQQLAAKDRINAEDYCQQKAAASGSSFYYSFLFLPQQRRNAITALYAFCREVDDIVDECSEPDIARVKLQWWREEIQRLFQDKPQHPVTQSLVQYIYEFDLAEEYFQEIIDGMAMDLEQTQYQDFKQLSLYCYRVASVVGLLSASIFGYQDRHTLDYAKDLGMAFQLTNILRDVREDAERGRIYIPLDELHEFGVAPAALSNGVTTPAMQLLFQHQAQRARAFYRSARAELPDVDIYAQRSGLIMAAIYEKILDAIEANDYRVLEQRIRIAPLRKLWIAWRAARRINKAAVTS